MAATVSISIQPTARDRRSEPTSSLRMPRFAGENSVDCIVSRKMKASASQTLCSCRASVRVSKTPICSNSDTCRTRHLE